MSRALADPPGEWRRISPRLAVVRELSAVITTVVLLAATSVPLALRLAGVWPGCPAWLAWALPSVVLASGALGCAVIPFQVRATRYALREDDVAISRGVVYHRSEVIPYGRIQYVDVIAGPLLRAFGLCELQVHTASPDAHPEIPGLPRDVGDALRDELARRGEERLAGL